jgi:hypothetical protein
MLLVAGCGQQFVPEQRVEGVRLLAVRADPPEVGPGEVTHLTSLTFDAMGRAVDISWKLCTLPPSAAESTPVNSACITDQTDAGDYLVDLGTGDAIDFTVPQVDVRTLGIPDPSGGLYLPIRVRVTAGGDTTTGVYGLRYAYAPIPRNHNPAITDVLEVTARAGQDGGIEQAMPLAPMRVVHFDDQVDLRTELAMGSAEEYLRVSGSPPKITMATETLTQAWFSTHGNIVGGRLPADAPYSRFTTSDIVPLADGTPIDVWVVLHDGRGGIDWAHRELVYR